MHDGNQKSRQEILAWRRRFYAKAVPIWFAAFQPCGRRLHALLPKCLTAYEVDHGRLDADLRRSLLAVSACTLYR